MIEPSAPTRNWRARLLRGQSFRQWLGEFIKFCFVGGIAYVVDVGLFNLLRFGPGELLRERYVLAAVISVSVAVLVSWMLNRSWTFRGGTRHSRRRELIMFIAVNAGGMAIAVGCLWFSHEVLGYDSPLADNIAKNVVGLVLGMAFRYLCYRYIVFPGSFSHDDAAASPGD